MSTGKEQQGAKLLCTTHLHSGEMETIVTVNTSVTRGLNISRHPTNGSVTISEEGCNNSRITCLLNSLRYHALTLVTWHQPQKNKNSQPHFQLYRTNFTILTMSSPTMNAASILRNQSSTTTNFSTTSLKLSGMKTVMVGKDQHPVTIMQMAHVNEPTWKKAASFENIFNTAHSLLEAHNVADIMALVANKIPMDTGAAFQEAQSASKRITGDVFNIVNLNPSMFLNSDGKNIKFTPTIKIAERPEDLTYICFQCDLDGSELDRRVTTAREFSFQFCLKFPKHLFHIKDRRTHHVTMEERARKKNDGLREQDGVIQQ